MDRPAGRVGSRLSWVRSGLEIWTRVQLWGYVLWIPDDQVANDSTSRQLDTKIAHDFCKTCSQDVVTIEALLRLEARCVRISQICICRQSASVTYPFSHTMCPPY